MVVGEFHYFLCKNETNVKVKPIILVIVLHEHVPLAHTCGPTGVLESWSRNLRVTDDLKIATTVYVVVVTSTRGIYRSKQRPKNIPYYETVVNEP